jgi:hypothetical protein
MIALSHAQTNATEIENFKYQDIITSIPFVCPVENLTSILDHKYIYTNQARMDNKIHAVSGFGDAMGQNLIDSKTQFEIHPDSFGLNYTKNGKTYTDTFGVTVGCMCYGDNNYSKNRVKYMEKSQYMPEMCCIFINPNVLKHTYYHVNLGDNNGFYMYGNQKYVYTPLPDGRDMSYIDDTIYELSPEIYENYKKDIEIYIEESISTDYFIEVGFIDLHTLLMYKNVLNSLNIKCSMFNENTGSFNEIV